MMILYLLLALMITAALGLLAIPFVKHRTFKNFGLIAFLMILFSVGLYQLTSNPAAIKQWMTQGKQHYELLIEYNELGGIDGIIARVKKKVATNPQDAQGWFILGKLYLMKQDKAAALKALHNAHQLQPQDKKITHLYDLTAQ